MRTRDTDHVVNTGSDLTMVGDNSDAIIRMEFLEWGRIDYDALEEISFQTTFTRWLSTIDQVQLRH